MNENMKCRHVADELIVHFDEGSLQELPEELKAHIETCPNCRQALEDLIRLQNGLAELTPAEPNPGYWNNFLPKLRQRFENESSRRRGRDLAWIPAMGIALILALVLLTSPTQIGPPIWYESQIWAEGSTVLWDDDLTSEEWDKLIQITGNEDIVSTIVDASELELIEQLSETYPYPSCDLIDQLGEMEEESFNAFLQKLMDYPIIQS